MDETFFILLLMAISFKIHNTFYQNKFRYKLLLPPKLKNERKYLRIKIIYKGIYAG